MAEIKKTVVEPTYVLTLTQSEAEELEQSLGPIDTSYSVYDALCDALHG